MCDTFGEGRAVAGDWIPIRCNLLDDPAVIAVAAAVGIDECGVVGRLVKLWAWANQHTTDGNARGVTEAWIDRYVSAPGFALALLAAGWLEQTEEGVKLPNFDRWNSSSAKRRVLTNQRVAKCRDGKGKDGNARGVSKALPEKRREEKRRDKEELPSEACPEPLPAASEPTILSAPTTGEVKQWNLTASKLAEYEATFPTLDVLAALRAAVQWCKDNAAKRKTARGMPAFCTNWLTTSVNRGQFRKAAPDATGPTAHPTARATARPQETSLERVMRLAGIKTPTDPPQGTAPCPTSLPPPGTCNGSPTMPPASAPTSG